MTKAINSEYQKEVHETLEKCQFVEETLRVYFDLVIKIAKLKLSAYFPVQVTATDLSNLSLGKLVSLFSRLSGNAALKTLLQQITKERNFVAHRSLLFTLGDLYDAQHMTQSLQKLKAIKKRITKAHGDLLEETWSLRKALIKIELKKKAKP